MESLSYGLVGLSVLVGLISFLSAHSTPLPLPNVSKIGCTGAIALLVLAFIAGLVTPLSTFSTCTDKCTAVFADLNVESGEFAEKSYGEFQSCADAARNEYRNCVKGAVDADRKSKQLADEQGDPSLYTPIDLPAAKQRCQEQATGACHAQCFNPDPPPPSKKAAAEAAQ